jgi:hypothetical protein
MTLLNLNCLSQSYFSSVFLLVEFGELIGVEGIIEKKTHGVYFLQHLRNQN